MRRGRTSASAAPQRDLVAMRVEISKMYMKRRPSGSSHVRTRASNSRRFIRCANIAVHSDSEPQLEQNLDKPVKHPAFAEYAVIKARFQDEVPPAGEFGAFRAFFSAPLCHIGGRKRRFATDDRSMPSGPSSRSDMEIELSKLSSPRIFLVRMLVFLVLCGAGRGGALQADHSRRSSPIPASTR